MSQGISYSRQALVSFRGWLHDSTGNPEMLKLSRDSTSTLKALHAYFSQDARPILVIAQHDFVVPAPVSEIFAELGTVLDSMANTMLAPEDYLTYRQGLDSQRAYSGYVRAVKPFRLATSWTLLYALLTGKHNAVSEIIGADYFATVGYYSPGPFCSQMIDYVDTDGTLPLPWWLSLKGVGGDDAQ